VSPRLRRVGDFLLLEEIGSGGMGVVFRAEQRSLGRTVAVKILPSLAGLDSSAVERFRREAEVTGRLSHPGIVQVHAIDQADGIQFFAMELIGGPSLNKLLEELRGRTLSRLTQNVFVESGVQRRFPNIDQADRASGGDGSRYVRSCARIAAEVASALAAAHHAHVIHRDIKPSNILFRESGQPVLVDFGLARDEQALGLTRSGDAIGTPNYMSPEQASGSRDLDGRVDVWGLGATLYEMLTLQPPFSGETPTEILRRIAETDVVPVRSRNPAVPPDLAHIVETCLAKDPDARYPAVEALELDLRNFLDGRPVSARRPSPVRRGLKLLRRHRLPIAIATSVLFATTGLFWTMGIVRLEAEKRAGEDALAQALAAISTDLDLDRAQTHYGTAKALLGDAVVAAARMQHLRTVFESHYLAGRYEPLGSVLASIPESVRDEAWRELGERVRGRGILEVLDVPKSSTLRLLPIDADGNLGEWQPAEAASRLHLGAWLVEIEGTTHARVVHAVTITRDQTVKLRPCLYDLDSTRAAVGRVVPLGGERHGVLMAAAEYSQGELERLRGRLTAAGRADLVAELAIPEESGGASASAPNVPARGLNWRQARLVAIFEDAHVPDRAEYRAAANFDVPRILRPFGSRMDWSLVAAARDGGLRAPLPVESFAAGASPHEILHLVGNVRELLAPTDETTVEAIGGDFTCDDADDLVSEGERAVLRLGHETQDPRVGMRLVRFLPPISAAGEAERARAQRQEILASASVIHAWTIERDGSLTLRIALNGHHAVDRQVVEFAVVTPGFRQIGPIDVADGHGRRLEYTATSRAMDATDLTIRLPEAARANHAFKLDLIVGLAPLDGLTMVTAEHRLVLPIRELTTAAVVHTLTMPTGSSIEEVEPAPSLRVIDGDREQLVWHYGAGRSRSASSGSALVRFRVDGALTTRWPAFAESRAAAIEVLEALGRPLAVPRADALLDDRFVLLPHGATRSDLCGNSAPTDRFEIQEIVDVTAVGPTIRVRADVRWWAPARETNTAAPRLIAERWPLVVFLEAQGPRLRALAVAPATSADRGRFDGRRYSYEPMGVELALPPGMALLRDRGQAGEVQLLLRAQDLSSTDAWVQIVGYRAEPSEVTIDPIPRLSMGESFSPRARRLDPPGHDTDSPMRSDWSFEDFAGRVRRERWRRLDIGSRWRFLVRYCVRDRDVSAANRSFESAMTRAFFDSVDQAFTVSGAQPLLGGR
jgi:serine/threonine protein kinase